MEIVMTDESHFME